MDADYKERISRLIDKFPLPIDRDVAVVGRAPTSANSEFLTNKEQGDWAERLVVKAINDGTPDFVAVHYGRNDSIAAGDPGFADFYRQYQEELNTIGKKPDVLVFRKGDAPCHESELQEDECVSRAVAALEVRSSSFLCGKYKRAMSDRLTGAARRCEELRAAILSDGLGDLLREKNPVLHGMLATATAESFRELTIRAVSWSSTERLRELTALLRELKENIAMLHRRDYLSITPKIEDLALVNRWISRFGVPHHYLQVFFDRAYIIPFSRILEICADPRREGTDFTIERDVKNQGKTTAKINIDAGEPVIGRVDMPTHHSAIKELDRGRLLFYVKFDGGQGYLDRGLFSRVVSP